MDGWSPVTTLPVDARRVMTVKDTDAPVRVLVYRTGRWRAPVTLIAVKPEDTPKYWKHII